MVFYLQRRCKFQCFSPTVKHLKKIQWSRWNKQQKDEDWWTLNRMSLTQTLLGFTPSSTDIYVVRLITADTRHFSVEQKWSSLWYFNFTLIDFMQTISGPIKYSAERSGQSVICGSHRPGRKRTCWRSSSMSPGSLSDADIGFVFVLCSPAHFSLLMGQFKSNNTLIIGSSTI